MKGEHCYDLNCIDHITKYISAHLFVEKRTLPKCVEFLNQIKMTCYDQILNRCDEKEKIIFVSDKFGLYRLAFNKLFLYVATLRFGVPIKAKIAGLEHNNNPIERYNGSIEDRIKTMRGGFGSFDGAEAFMNLKHITHNFVNPHQQLKGITPAEAAEIRLPLGRNKLLDLIKYRSKMKMTKR